MDSGNDKKREALYVVQILQDLGRLNAIQITFQNCMFCIWVLYKLSISIFMFRQLFVISMLIKDQFWCLQTFLELRGHYFVLIASFDNIVVSIYDGLVVPGGREPQYLALNEYFLKLVKQFSDSNKPIASICLVQLILTGAGVLKEKTCTTYPIVKHFIIVAGGVWKYLELISTCFVDRNLLFP